MMGAKEIQKLSREIREQHRIKEVSLAAIRSIIQEQGYTIIEFDAFDNDKDIDLIIERLDLTDLVTRHSGFTYADSEFRLVFVKKSLNDQEKSLVLLHEAGHVLCNHLEHAPVLGAGVCEEDEANQFVHHMLRPCVTDKIHYTCSVGKRKITIAGCIIAALIIGLGCYSYSQKQASYYGEYYITENGERYHEAECMFVKDKENVRRLTKEEYESGQYTPCRVCLPD